MPANAHNASPIVQVEIQSPDGRVSTVGLQSQPALIGRSEIAPIKLISETVSRRHAELYRDREGRWWVRDLGSSNGTRVNGFDVTEMQVGRFDEVEIGEYRLRVLTEASAIGSVAPAGPIVTMFRANLSPEGADDDISTLGEIASPKIDISHLNTLGAYAEEARRATDPQERLVALCRLLVTDDFHGRCAVALRLDRRSTAEAPPLLCPPFTATGVARQAPYLSRGLLRVVRERGMPALAAHASSDPEAVQMTMYSSASESAAAACPLRTSGDAIDVLYVTLPAQYATGEWLTLFAHAARTYEQVESTLEAQRQAESRAVFERDLQQASEIQRGLVPRNLAVPGLEIAIGFMPCRTVGGDYVDVLRTADGRTLLAIADVSGKGMPAAMVASTIHSMVHTCQRVGIDLERMMRALDEHLCEHLQESSFVTMIALVIDPSSGAYELINAGHPAPVVVAPDGALQELQCGVNLPLGVRADDLEVARGSLEGAHLLALFTDGLTELTDASGRELGPERIAGHLKDLCAQSAGAPEAPERIAEGLTLVLEGYLAGRPPLDDRTFLLARRARVK